MIPDNGTAMRLGVNYTPSKHWFHSWAHPDWDSVRRDMDDILALEADHVRILPLWHLLQPNRTWIDPQAVEDVRRTCEIAAERGLGVSVDALQGHLSSFDFVPSWVLTWHRRSLVGDAEVVRAQLELVERLEGALSDLPTYWGLTLGNEFNQFVSATHPSGMSATPQEVEEWLRTLLADSCDPGAPAPSRGPRPATVTGAGTTQDRRPPSRLHAENDAVWFEDGHPFQPRHASALGAVTSVHSWVFNGTAQAYGPLSFESTHLAAYLVELARAFAPTRTKPVWVQEIGAPLSVMDVTQAESFLEESVQAVAQRPGVPALTWWCSHDVSRDLGDFPELEHTLGLVDQEHRLKPLGLRFRECARAGKGAGSLSPSSGDTTGAPLVVVDVDEDDVPLSRRELAPGGGVFETWMAACREDPRAGLITSIDAERAGGSIPALVRATPTGRSFYSAVSDPSFFEEGAVQHEAGARQEEAAAPAAGAR